MLTKITLKEIMLSILSSTGSWSFFLLLALLLKRNIRVGKIAIMTFTSIPLGTIIFLGCSKAKAHKDKIKMFLNFCIGFAMGIISLALILAVFTLAISMREYSVVSNKTLIFTWISALIIVPTTTLFGYKLHLFNQ